MQRLILESGLDTVEIFSTIARLEILFGNI